MSEFLSQTHLVHVSSLAGRAPQSRIQPVMRETTGSRGVPPGFLPPFGRWRSLLGPSCPAGDLRLPYSRPTKTGSRRPGPQPGFPRSTRVRCDRGGRPLYPGAVVSTRATRNEPPGTRRFATASPTALFRQPIDGASAVTRHQPRVQLPSPVRSSPRPWLPGWNRGPPAFPRAPHPAVTSNARRGGDRSLGH